MCSNSSATMVIYSSISVCQFKTDFHVTKIDTRAKSKAIRVANNSKGSFSYLLLTLCPALSNDTTALQTSAVLRHP